MSNLISYSQFIKDRNNFRKAGWDFNKFDTPGLKFFKIFFYFNNGDSEGIANDMTSGGLLAPTWLLNAQPQNWHLYNSAWSYLKMNCEDERASMLENFVTLLSNISSESPWYFTELGGLDAALERKQAMERDFKIDEARYKISIKCLPDAFDDRIATLLELYRSISWSWIKKQSVLPANLRKFDMGILVYEIPNKPFHIEENLGTGRLNEFNPDKASFSMVGNDDTSDYKSSYKYFELHNCEFDYTSGKGNMSAISNAEGLQPEYTIDIHFDDCFETRYNEFSFQTFGDIVQSDINYMLSDDDANKEKSNAAEIDLEFKTDYYEYDRNQKHQGTAMEVLDEKGKKVRNIRRLEGYPKYKNYDNGAIYNAISQVVGTGINAVTSLAKKAVLGNLFSFSLTRMVGQAKDLLQGDIWSSARNVNEYIQDSKQRNEYSIPAGHSLFSKPNKILPTVKRIGNMHQANTLANNI